MNPTVKTILTVCAFVALAIWLYPAILSISAVILTPLYPYLPKTRATLVSVMVSGASVGAILSAALCGFPLGFLTRQRPLVIGGVLGVAGAGTKYLLYPGFIEDFDWFIGSIALGEDLVFLLAALYFTRLGSRLANRVAPGEGA